MWNLMSLFKSKCSKSKLPNMKKIAEHSKVFYLKFTDICRQERHAVTVSPGKYIWSSSMPPWKLKFGMKNLFNQIKLTT